MADVKGSADILKMRSKASAASLGVVRLDYNYPPAPGDIDHPGSYQCVAACSLLDRDGSHS